MTLEQLFQAYCDGDQQAFDSIDKHLRPLLLAVISSKGIDKATADDVVQATMLKVIRHRNKFDSTKGSLAGWCLRMAHRNALDQWRLATNRKSCHFSTLDRNGHCDDSAHFEPTDHRFVESSERAVQNENARQVREALSKLSPRDRAVIESVYFDGLTLNRTAIKLGMPLGSVSSCVRNGLRKLRKHLGQNHSPFRVVVGQLREAA
jgi:RNA polymerase sigma-70 factor (ECF subfamily)